jgi:hypothetical protein
MDRGHILPPEQHGALRRPPPQPDRHVTQPKRGGQNRDAAELQLELVLSRRGRLVIAGPHRGVDLGQQIAHSAWHLVDQVAASGA